MFDFSELRGRMIAKFGTCAACAEAVGMSRSQMSDRLSGKINFQLDEIYALCAPDVLDIHGNEQLLKAKGRHDPCVVPRAVPIVEAMAAITVLDYYLQYKAEKH